jgi:putative FmdB family regulatory protein
MPIFEFQCDACGYQFEKIVLGSPDGKTLSCPACGSRKIIRKLSTFGISGGQPASGGAGTGCGSSPFT